eukprot:gnl/MRDRNA2_/MRDRNA2_77692_c0_seq1.p1 gnl/MRDRNA2_/MRDRNA2_77692_c0~~gnl/MRDRNA2_/MRDRNA2_77692_c0_seq1.p1  ORF type:complete len:506 (-),score=77.36 gnl/MRDRNA2_/MRDRNA2_77692_c0_seq1:179-1600(-)
MAHLEKILKVSGAAVILSSNWRRSSADIACLNAVLHSRRLPPIYDKTQVKDKDTPWYDNNWMTEEVSSRPAWEKRQEEITGWLAAHPNIQRWVAIDYLDLNASNSYDSNASKKMVGHIIQTDPQFGLSTADAEHAIAVLGSLGEDANSWQQTAVKLVNKVWQEYEGRREENVEYKDRALFNMQFPKMIEVMQQLTNLQIVWHGKPVFPPSGDVIPELFPPPKTSGSLCAASVWYPAPVIGDVVVSFGGSGLQGPSGLFQALQRRLPGLSFLCLDAGPCLASAVSVVRAAMYWLLTEHRHARVWLLVHSTGAGVAAHIIAAFPKVVDGLVIVACQGGHTFALKEFNGKAVLMIHSEADGMVDVGCLHYLAEVVESQWAGKVRKEIVPKSMRTDQYMAKLRQHVLWDERHYVLDILIEWFKENTGVREVTKQKTQPDAHQNETPEFEAIVAQKSMVRQISISSCLAGCHSWICSA